MTALRDRGFTLLELLIAIAVLGLLIGLLNQGLAFAVQVSAIRERLSDGPVELPAVDAALRRLIAKADPGVYPEPASLTGTSTSLALVTQAPGRDGALRPVEAALFAAGGSMRLRLTDHRHVERFGPPGPAETLELLGGVDGLEIDYSDSRTGAWRTSWSADTLPSLVRIRLVFAGGAKRWPPIIVAPRLEAPGQ